MLVRTRWQSRNRLRRGSPEVRRRGRRHLAVRLGRRLNQAHDLQRVCDVVLCRLSGVGQQSRHVGAYREREREREMQTLLDQIRIQIDRAH